VHVGFIHKEFVTMHGHTIVKFTAQDVFQNLLCLKAEMFLSPYVILNHLCHIFLSDCSIM